MSISDEGFADVLNGLAGGGRRKRKDRPEPQPQPPQPVEEPDHDVDRSIWSWTIPSSAPVVTPAAAPVTEYDLGDAAIVRPYAWTGGRTKSTVDFQIETMVSTSEHGENIDALTQTEHRFVAELCAEPRSVAEVATLLSVPLGVAKVLLGDMAGLGLVIVHKTIAGGANKAHLMLMERVLSGLRRL
ncbi:DUF742 domain-containing protein [Actinophytocola oryzae]|uniref:Uncharacterized protein DUF742 n=1 Tax=Actinophytocola oryzae TaxID=502181 RepID=A0A4R7VAW6_9PSEU|nr:DUF742 domain-containing protein [Actinophytocola oryzae]TDV46143.1 uncharacterized protein DUF742 [Actinophytocola oryzae]